MWADGRTAIATGKWLARGAECTRGASMMRSITPRRCALSSSPSTAPALPRLKTVRAGGWRHSTVAAAYAQQTHTHTCAEIRQQAHTPSPHDSPVWSARPNGMPIIGIKCCKLNLWFITRITIDSISNVRACARPFGFGRSGYRPRVGCNLL